MEKKEKYYKLDDMGIIGSQEKASAASWSYHKKKTGEIFRRAKASNASLKISPKKASY